MCCVHVGSCVRSVKQYAKLFFILVTIGEYSCAGDDGEIKFCYEAHGVIIGNNSCNTVGYACYEAGELSGNNQSSFLAKPFPTENPFTPHYSLGDGVTWCHRVIGSDSCNAYRSCSRIRGEEFCRQLPCLEHFTI